MQTVLITGVGKGIGKALARKFLAEGWFVIGTYLNTPPDFTHTNFKTYALDLSKPESIQNCVAELAKSGAKIDILINNAGALFDDEETSVVVEKLRQTLEVNVVGTIDFTERILSLINHGGHIVNISSTAGSLADSQNFTHSHAPFRYPAYKISKAALNMYTRTLALRMGREETGITVSSLHPGWVRTEMGGEGAEMSPEEAADGIYGVAIKRPETGGFWFKNERVSW